MTAAVNLASVCTSLLWTRPLWIHIWEDNFLPENNNSKGLKPRTFPPRTEEKPSVWTSEKTSFLFVLPLGSDIFSSDLFTRPLTTLAVCPPHRPLLYILDTALCPQLGPAADSGQRPAEDQDKQTIEDVRRWDDGVKFLQCFLFVCENCYIHAPNGTSAFSRFCTETARRRCRQLKFDPAEDQIKTSSLFPFVWVILESKKEKRKIELSLLLLAARHSCSTASHFLICF